MSTSPFSTRGIGALGVILCTVFVATNPTSTAFAQQKTSYNDVPAGAYYEDAASALLELGALDSGEARLRPGDSATRAELVKLLVNLRNEAMVRPSVSSFNDVALSTWYSPYFEAAAQVGWVHGDGNCYQSFRPCTARPASSVNRAEAAALLARAFGLEHTGAAPQFPDASQSEWYYMPIQTAADHCVLQGDGGTGRVRPAASMNRAEMVVMFHRAYLNMQYGEDCGPRTSGISTVSVVSPTLVRVTFDDAINVARAEDAHRYTITRVSGGASIGISAATLIGSNTVELDLSTSLAADTQYSLSAQSLATTAGAIFSDSARFTFEGEAGDITDVTATSSTRIRLTFNTDITRSYAEDESRFTVTRSVGGGTLGIQSASLLDSRTVELLLATTLSGNISYRVNVQNLRTTADVAFSDTATFVFPLAANAHIVTVTAPTSTRIRVVFDTDLDIPRAEQTGRYAVSDGSRTYSLRTANLLDDRRTVELELVETLTNQRSYTVNAQELLTADGNFFTDSHSFIFDAGVGASFIAMLTGLQEIPYKVTTATGTGTFILTGNSLQYDITVKNMSGAITAAHFHQGDVGVVGSVAMAITFNGQRATGSWTNMTDLQRNAILDREIYVNVHTALNPDGEIRGQILPQ